MFQPLQAQTDAVDRILILHSYHPQLKWTKGVAKGIEDTFYREKKDTILYHEYMDTKRFPLKTVEPMMIRTLKEKYADIKLRLVITTDNAALTFANNHKSELFPDIPVVFCGVNNFQEVNFFGNKQVTGVVEDHDIKSSIDMILQVFPNTNSIYVINDITLTGQLLHASFKSATSGYNNIIKFHERIGVPKEELEKELLTLPKDAVILFFSYYRDKEGRQYKVHELLDAIAISNRPIFSFWYYNIGHGVLGGRTIDPISQGEKVAEMALQALTVSDVRTIPIELKSPTVDIFNYQQMVRFGVQENKLPPGSRVVFRYEESGLLQNEPFIVGVIGTLCVSLLALTILFISKKNQLKSLPRGKEKYFGHFFQQGSDPMYLLNKDGVIVHVNAQGCEVLGYQKEELIGQNAVQIDLCFKVPSKLRELYEAFDKDLTLRWNSQHIRKDGTCFPVDIRISFFEYKNRPYALGVARDMSLQYKELEKIRANENSHQNLMRNLPGLIFQLRKNQDQQLQFDFISPRATILFNLNPETQTPIEDFIQLLPEDDQPLFATSLKYALEKEVEWFFEKRFIPSQGNIQWYQGALSAINEDDSVIFTIVMLETTEKHQAEKALAQTEKTYLELFNAMQDGLIVIDQQGDLVDMNRTICEQFGYAKEELLENSCELLIKDSNCRRHILAPSNSGVSMSQFPMRFPAVRKDGSVFTIEVDSKEVELKGVKYILAIIHDISDIMKSEQERKKLETQMFRLQRIEAIGTLAGGIAHDFNNILSPILGYTEMAMEELPQNHEIREYLEPVFDAGIRAKELIKQILTFSRDTDHEFSAVKIQPIIKEVIKLSRATIPTTIEIEQSITDACGLIMADPVQVHQILMNLFTNAYHAMSENGGRLKISLKEVKFSEEDLQDKELIPGAYAELSISDTGTGMSSEIMEHVFDPYFSTKEKDKGTGLGLSVVHGIVKNYGGKISVYSELGIGTVFKIYLPIVSDKEINIRKETLADLKTQNHERILIVDDEESIVKLLKNIISSLGYQVTVFSNSAEALKEVIKNHSSYDIILTDMTMPEVTGLDIAKNVKSLSPDVKVVLCTGFSDQLQGKNLDDLPIDGLIMKPLIRLDLAKMLKNVLSS